jgi:hypothetical protein
LDIDMLKKFLLSVVILCFVFLSFSSVVTLEGTYDYAGGIYNNKPEAASKEYILQRRYNDEEYESTFLEPGQDTVVYEQGKYKLLQDTCLETQTYSKQPSKTLNITVPYTYVISHDTLKLFGKLPNGTTVQEYWKKVKL